MHASNKITIENLKEVVYWHKPTAEKVPKFEIIANACEVFMRVILENSPDCADRSTALRAARSARMWANSALSIDNGEIDHTRGQKK
jgi:hypothetical protein